MKESKARKIGIIRGFLGGLIGCVMCQVFGVLLCLTGIGLILGIPIMVVGLGLPFAFLGTWYGKCPVCKAYIEIRKSATCKSCRHRIVRQGKMLVCYG